MERFDGRSYKEVRDVESTASKTGWMVRIGAGLVAGAAIAFTDNSAFAGEVSPIVIVAMLLAAAGAAGALWGRRGWIAAAAAWAWIPLTHLVKHLLGLPDTLHPNTFRSILMVGAFSLAVAAVGVSCGMAVHGLRAAPRNGE